MEIGTSGLVYLSLLEKTGITDRVYLHDKLNDVYYGMTDNKVSLYLEAGSYENRFFLTFKEDSALSIEDELNFEKTMLVYANSDKQLFINMNSDTHIQNISIYNTVGVLEGPFFRSDTAQKEHVLDVSSLIASIYIVRIETDKGVVTKKVLVK